jgi:hypothetical protein
VNIECKVATARQIRQFSSQLINDEPVSILHLRFSIVLLCSSMFVNCFRHEIQLHFWKCNYFFVRFHEYGCVCKQQVCPKTVYGGSLYARRAAGFGVRQHRQWLPSRQREHGQRLLSIGPSGLWI